MTRSTNSNVNSEKLPKQVEASGELSSAQKLKGSCDGVTPATRGVGLRTASKVRHEHDFSVSPGWVGSLEDSKWLGPALAAAGFAVLCFLAFRSWIPHDEGTLAQVAQRVLGGEVPHVDFHDMYGGLQAYVHAVAFRVLGPSIHTLRLVNLLVAGIAGISLYAVVRRMHPPFVAGSAAVAMFVVAFASYPAAMPSWWNVALGLVAAFLVLLWRDSGRSSLLVFAGVTTGMSFLVKSTGAYIAAGVLLYLLILISRSPSRRGAARFCGFLVVLCFGALLAFGSPTFQNVALMWLPLSMLVVIGFRSAVDLDGGPPVTWSAVAIFSVSFLAPILIHVAPIVASGHAAALVDGWILIPSMRFEGAALELFVAPSSVFVLFCVAGVITYARKRLGPRVAYASLAAFILAIAIISWQQFWFLLIICVLLAPLFVALAWVSLRRRPTSGLLLTSILLATFAFIQYPLSNGFYALYVVPWALVAVAWLLGGRVQRASLALILVVLASIVGVQIQRGYMHPLLPSTAPVEMVGWAHSRAGISIPTTDRFYIELIQHLQPHSGSAIYAGPDAPEIYFLSNTENRTPVLFDFLAATWGSDDLRGLIASGELSAVVLNQDPDFSHPLSDDMLRLIENHFPRSTRFGKFIVYEREG